MFVVPGWGQVLTLRAQQRAEAMVADELAAYRLAERRLTLAREELHEALERAMAAGHTAYRLAQVTGLSQAWIGRLRMQATTAHRPSGMTKAPPTPHGSRGCCRAGVGSVRGVALLLLFVD